MSMEAQDDPIGRTLDRRFLVRRVIGVGGMGVVYEVEHVVTKKLGALKLLQRSLASESSVVERFVREASAAARIRNRHIVETYDAGELPSGEPYMFMELLHGAALRDLLRARGRLSFAETREILLQAASGLAAAHAAGIVHRDIKPENLFMASGSSACVKILDFGISKFALHSDHRLTTEGAPMGTPYYMSPEQVVGRRDLDERCDVYALGVVLYECVTGSVPFDAPSLPALSIKIFEGRYTPPREIQRDAPPGLDELVGRAMAVEPSARYQSMGEFKAALETFAVAPTSLATTLANAGTTAPSVAESGAPEASGIAMNASQDARSNDSVGASTESKAPGRGRSVLMVGIAAAAVVGVAAALQMAKRPSAVTPDDVHAPKADGGRALAVHSLPPTARPPDSPKPGETSAPAASGAAGAGEGNAPAASVLDPSRARAPKSHPSAPSRAARDGLTEENPFRE
jgi:serine/threonine protein kinase